MNCELVLDARAELGEGPLWDDRRQRLYITSAWGGLDAAVRAHQPHAGGLFRLRSGARGQKINRFAG